jgi:hypothetical protein
MKKQLFACLTFIGVLLLIQTTSHAQSPTSLIGQFGLAWHPNGSKFAVGDASRLIYILDSNGQILKILSGHSNAVGPVYWSPDGDLLASGGLDDQFVMIWDVANGNLLRKLHPSDQGSPAPLYYGVFDLGWSPDGKHILAMSFDAFQFWETDNWQPSGPAQSGSLFDAEWSPNGADLAIADYMFTLYDGNSLQIDNPNTDSIRDENGDRSLALGWSADGLHLVTIGFANPKVTIWNAQSRLPISTFTAPSERFKDVAFISGNRVAAITENGRLYVVDINGNLLATYETGVEEVRALAWNPQLKLFAVAGKNTVIGEVSGLRLPIIPLSTVLGPSAISTVPPTATFTPSATPTNTPTAIFTPTIVAPSIFTKLQLTSVCSMDAALTRRWQVRNSNAFALPFNWRMFGSTQTGSGIAVANGDTFFEVNTINGTNTLRLFVGNQLQEVKISGGVRCP